MKYANLYVLCDSNYYKERYYKERYELRKLLQKGIPLDHDASFINLLNI